MDPCGECYRLRNHYIALLKQETDLLREFHSAITAGDLVKADSLNGPLAGALKFTQLGLEDLRTHEATHAERKSPVPV
jgi:hypothetical protein